MEPAESSDPAQSLQDARQQLQVAGKTVLHLLLQQKLQGATASDVVMLLCP